jgi:hypothetical protein
MFWQYFSLSRKVKTEVISINISHIQIHRLPEFNTFETGKCLCKSGGGNHLVNNFLFKTTIL